MDRGPLLRAEHRSALRTCRRNYELLELHYNNAFLAPRELGLGPSLTPEVAYQQGYARQTDRREKFPWNADVEEVLEMDPSEAETFFLSFFERYEGQFELTRPQ